MSTMNLQIGARPELLWVDVSLIDVDGSYQREADGRRVQRMLKNFRWDHFGAVVLARKANGRFAVTDGQHRVKAAQLHPTISEVPALVINLDGVVAEAENFLAINRERKGVTAVETYWAGLTAGDAACVLVSDVLGKAGCMVVTGPGEYKPRHTAAVSAVGRAIERYGDAAVIQALRTICTAWPDDERSLRGTLITALSRLHRANKLLNMDRLHRTLGAKTPAELTTAAESFRKLSGGSAETALSKAIVELYNKGLSGNTIMIGQAA